MLLQNPILSAVDLELKKVNGLNAKQYKLKNEYKSFDRQNNDDVYFIVWDIKNQVVTKNGFVVDKLNYEGKLSFVYSKKKNEVTILECPTIVFGNVKVPYFTHDLANIVKEKLSKETELQTVNIKFPSQTFLAVIDDKVGEVIPAIEKSQNLKLLKGVVENIAKEEAKIVAEVKQQKTAKDAHDARIERALEKKSKILGLARSDFASKEEYEKALNERVREYADKKIANIDRHLQATQAKLRGLLFPYWKDELVYHLDYIEDDEEFFEEADKYLDKNEPLPKELVFKALDTIVEESIDEVLPAIEKVRDEYTWMANSRIDKKSDYLGNINKDIYDQLGSLRFISLFFNKSSFDFSNNSRLDKRFELIMQIDALKKQKKMYENLVKNKNAAVDFKSNTFPYGYVMELPYFLRVGRNIKRDKALAARWWQGTGQNLLMIKPGTKQIDLKNIKQFTRRNGWEFGKTRKERRDFIDKFYEKDHHKCCSLSICVPSSLEYQEILKLINYAFENSEFRHFVCETPEVANVIKNIYLDRAYDVYCKGLEKDRYNVWYDNLFSPFYVNVDNDYYKNFMINNPTNADFFDQYRPFRRKRESRKPYQNKGKLLDDMASSFFALHDKPLPYIKEILLGGYASEPCFATKQEIEDPTYTCLKSFAHQNHKIIPYQLLKIPRSKKFGFDYGDRDYEDEDTKLIYDFSGWYEDINDYGEEDWLQFSIEDADHCSFISEYYNEEFEEYIEELEMNCQPFIEPSKYYNKQALNLHNNFNKDVPPICEPPTETEEQNYEEASKYLETYYDRVEAGNIMARKAEERFKSRNKDLFEK